MALESNLKHITNLQQSIVAFFDELIDMFPNEGDFVMVRFMIKDRIPATQLVEHFTKNLLPEKEVIKARKFSFFDKNVLLSQLGQEKGENFKKLVLSLDKEDMSVIWKWLDAFCILTEKCR